MESNFVKVCREIEYRLVCEDVSRDEVTPDMVFVCEEEEDAEDFCYYIVIPECVGIDCEEDGYEDVEEQRPTLLSGFTLAGTGVALALKNRSEKS